MIQSYMGKTDIDGQVHEIISDLISIEKSIYEYSKKEFGASKETIDMLISKGKQATSLMASGMSIEEAAEVIDGKEARRDFELHLKDNTTTIEDEVSPRPNWA